MVDLPCLGALPALPWRLVAGADARCDNRSENEPMAEVDAKQVNRSSRMKWGVSLTYDGSNLPKTGIDQGDRSSRPLVRVSESLSRSPSLKMIWKISLFGPASEVYGLGV